MICGIHMHLEIPWKSLKIAVGANFIQPRFSIAQKEQAQKDLQDEIAHVVEELKKT